MVSLHLYSFIEEDKLYFIQLVLELGILYLIHSKSVIVHEQIIDADESCIQSNLIRYLFESIFYLKFTNNIFLNKLTILHFLFVDILEKRCNYKLSIYYDEQNDKFQIGNKCIKTILYIPQKDPYPMKKDLFQCISSISDFDLPIHNFSKDQNSHQMQIISLQQINPSIQQFADYINRVQQPHIVISQPSINQHVLESLQQSIAKTPTKKKKNGCVCKKTNCLKLYCECFASGKLCTEQCSCFKCCNVEGKSDAIHSARFLRKSKSHLASDKGCNCKKSNCHKKYCECFNAGIQCTSSCNCCDCHNMGTKAKIDTPNNKQSQDSQRN